MKTLSCLALFLFLLVLPVLALAQVGLRCRGQFARANLACGALARFNYVDNEATAEAAEGPAPVEHKAAAEAAKGPVPVEQQARRHRHRDFGPSQVCCRLLKEIENNCVCDELLMLPLFLVAPAHDFHINVFGECKVTFKCGMQLSDGGGDDD